MIKPLHIYAPELKDILNHNDRPCSYRHMVWTSLAQRKKEESRESEEEDKVWRKDRNKEIQKNQESRRKNSGKCNMNPSIIR